MKVLLTNDDGIQASGLHAFRHALLNVPGIELAVIAPDSNRSAIGRGITTRAPLYVEEVDFGDGTKGFQTDGTPVDCVRFATLGLLEWQPELIVSGINHGANLGDDITYSGTVAAAFEGVILGVPAIAVSQQARRGQMGWSFGEEMDFANAAAFAAGLVERIDELPIMPGTLLNVNVPAGPIDGARVCRLGKRIYRDKLELQSEEGARRRYRIYGDDPSYVDEDGTDFEAIAEHCVAVTPVHFDLTSRGSLAALGEFDLEALVPDQAAETPPAEATLLD
ncbi:MAG: 5'/3'-nucleotidase SurE [Solirubrobacterales bacterium]